MKNILLIILLIFTSLNAEIAIIKTAKGTVEIKRMYDILPAKVGDLLKEGDIVITKEDSSAGIIFDDGTRLSLGAKSYIAIEKYIFDPENKKFAFDLNMTKGKAIFESGKFGVIAPKKVKFRVPDGIIAIKGTKFYVDVR